MINTGTTQMRKENSGPSQRYFLKNAERGYTLIEILIGSVIMLLVVLATLSLYVSSNRLSVDQQQFASLQHDVRSAMFFISRDVKSICAGVNQRFAAYFIQGVNNDINQSSHPYQTDRITFLGNSDPLRLLVQTYVPGTGTVTLEPTELPLYPYTANAYPADPLGYVNRAILILPDPEDNTTNGELGQITGVDLASSTITFNTINITLPNGLVPGGASADYSGGTVHFIELKTYWLDMDGNYPGLTAGSNGYLGLPGVVYVSQWNPMSNAYDHLALALNCEDLQFQYHGDMNGDQLLDDNNGDSVISSLDFINWGDIYDFTNPTVLAGIRFVRIMILGKTENPYVSVSGTPPAEVTYIYTKPTIADSPAGAQIDRHRRFLLESTANIRNMSLNVYNTGTI
ncbi:MAG: prepilin-type N-terminal cleavage/methylation domain-containing protein [Candidatus Aminicenantes bacterium]|nr:prepilin-type N-terminal cleavage/methylation domain-containing protein [Candidatus Aminicenantes bacterium]